MYHLGIDPGLSGALAFYDKNDGELLIYDMPTFEIKVNNKNKRQIDLYQLADIVRGHAKQVERAVVELVNAMPGQGVTSSFNFGFAAGCAQMVLAAHQVPMTTVSPQRWKKVMGLTADKDVARKIASQTLPRHAGMWPLVKHDGRAEAAMLAYYLAHKA